MNGVSHSMYNILLKVVFIFKITNMPLYIFKYNQMTQTYIFDNRYFSVNTTCRQQSPNHDMILFAEEEKEEFKRIHQKLRRRRKKKEKVVKLVYATADFVSDFIYETMSASVILEQVFYSQKKKNLIKIDTFFAIFRI